MRAQSQTTAPLLANKLLLLKVFLVNLGAVIVASLAKSAQYSTKLMNVDPSEIQKFDDMATHWWDKSGPCKPLHDLNPLRLDFILSHCKLAHGNVLDIGCGGGILTEALSQFSTSIWGIDQSEKALQVAKTHAQSLSHPPRYEQITAEQLAVEYPAYFDVITCMELLEHVPDPLSIIKACSALLKPGGHLFYSTINRNVKSFLFAIVGAEYVLKLLPQGTHDYERFIQPSELAQWSKSAHLSLKHLKGISYNFLSKRYHLSQDVSVNYLMHFEKD